ncbi:MAG TPA: flagellar hook-basal body complex protein FliE [Fervidobacterium sp.]|nr:flagellar hook-basal body complex protein FliE [Fervidobacterium sp.]HOH53068.1 flagellar hook-basal body complex protein FliE [Fervidobacterium sp.]HQO05608.1 flagellar hook-basal body complex protein FliE [Fervidobacterium sp.]
MIERISGVQNLQNAANVTNTQNVKSDSDFGKILSDAIKSVNDEQKAVEQLSDDFAQGKVSNIHELVVEAEKASISLRLTVEVRNKIVDAYREIMRMQF